MQGTRRLLCEANSPSRSTNVSVDVISNRTHSAERVCGDVALRHWRTGSPFRLPPSTMPTLFPSKWRIPAQHCDRGAQLVPRGEGRSFNRSRWANLELEGNPGASEHSSTAATVASPAAEPATPALTASCDSLHDGDGAATRSQLARTCMVRSHQLELRSRRVRASAHA